MKTITDRIDSITFIPAEYMREQCIAYGGGAVPKEVRFAE